MPQKHTGVAAVMGDGVADADSDGVAGQ